MTVQPAGTPPYPGQPGVPYGAQPYGGGYGTAPGQVPARPATPTWTPPGTPAPATASSGGGDQEPPPISAGYTLPDGRPQLERLLYGLVAAGGSDMHLTFGLQPRFRVRGSLLPVAGEPECTDEQLERLLREALTHEAWEEFERTNDLDTAYAMSEAEGAATTARFRVNVFRSMGHIGLVARVIPTKIATLDDLGVLPQVKTLADKPRGLILVCGPTGSGKALHLNTPIPTPAGYKTIGDLREGDTVLGSDGKPCRVTGLSPVYEHPLLYRVVLSDGQIIIADHDHQWVVSTHHSRNVPRTMKRLKALDRHNRAHAVADDLELLAETYEAADTSDTSGLYELLVARGWDAEFPSEGVVYNALRMTDCPSWTGSRPVQVNRSGEREIGPFRYPVREVLEHLARSTGTRSPIAAELLTSGDYPEYAICREIGELLGGAPHNTARDIVRRFNIKGVPTRISAYRVPTGTKSTTPVNVYPTGVALKSLAARLRERFAIEPAVSAGMFRMSTGELLASRFRLSAGHLNYAIPVASAVELPQAELPVDPYVLGVWLGDGATDGSRITSDPRNDWDVSDQDHLMGHLREAGYQPTQSASNAYVINTPKLHTHLRRAGVLGDKHVPMEYMRASQEQRLALLQGLMDTDGTISRSADFGSGNCELSFSDRRLAADALELIRSLGIKASVCWDQPAGYVSADGTHVEGEDRHRIHFTTTEQVFRLPRKAQFIPSAVRETQSWIYIESIEPIVPGDPEYGPARCISVDSPDHTYLCGNGYVVTSNSTTMAGLIDLINTTRSERIFTFEDPVEFVHHSKKCLVSHREIGTDTPSFAEGLRRVRREDPDIILIGELRDYETIDAAIEAADTGHLVLGTLHTNSAPETISRIINSFPEGRQNQVRTTLASVLLAVICQTLVPSDTSPRGRVVATEIMMVTPGIRNNIRENDIPAISNALTDTTAGSISLDAHLAKLVQTGLITQQAALAKASSPGGLMRQLGVNDRHTGI